MKRFVIAYFIGALMVLAFYFVFPLLMEGEMLDLSSKRVLNQMMIIGAVFGIVFTLIAVIAKKNRSKQETEKAMKEYFEYQLRKEKEKNGE